ncbi:hypothetical protein MMC19_001109 [Ptychographa xylographoides]|nr:hypothetical protein [Ptychographa xylographoides]
MSMKCVHKGCGHNFTDPEEACLYHPGPPVFHEGQKGWKCCKTRVLTFDEFLGIPPCTTGKHSTIDDPPVVTQAENNESTPAPKPVPVPDGARMPVKAPQPMPQEVPEKTPLEPESDADDPKLQIAPNTTCRRRKCEATSTSATTSSREGEECIYHPGHPIFHEGQKGWTCCKKRVLEFDEFMQIEGCERKPQHMFVGSGKKAKTGSDGGEEKVENVKHDFYQTATTVHASLYLKKINKGEAKISFLSEMAVELDLPTTDKKRYKAIIPLYGSIDPARSTWKIMGTKMELALVKSDGLSWPVLRADERRTGEIIQVGKAGRA